MMLSCSAAQQLSSQGVVKLDRTTEYRVRIVITNTIRMNRGKRALPCRGGERKAGESLGGVRHRVRFVTYLRPDGA